MRKIKRWQFALSDGVIVECNGKNLSKVYKSHKEFLFIFSDKGTTLISCRRVK